MGMAVRAGCEAAAWAFGSVFLGLFLVAIHFRVSVPVDDIAAFAAALGLVGAVIAFASVAFLVKTRFPMKSSVVGARRGAAVGLLVVVGVPVAVAAVGMLSDDTSFNALGLVFWSVVAGGLPFAAAGAFLGRWMDKRLFLARGD